MYFYKKCFVKPNYPLLLMCFWFLPMQSQYTSIPDPIFEQELINQGIDSNPIIDHQVLTSDVNNRTELNIEVNNINNFEGLQDFTNLETLKIISYNFAPILNLENNVLLKHILLSGFDGILSLDLTNNVLLETIQVSSNSLSNVNINTCVNLKKLILSDCHITNIDLSNNLNLEELGLLGVNLTSLNINNNLALKKIGLFNTQFTSLDFSNNTNLEEIILINLGGPITTFNPLLFSNNVNLKKLIVDHVSFYPTVNLQNNLQLETCVLWSAGLFNLDVSNNISLKILRIDGNFFDDINIQSLNQLQIFGCTYNNIASLNFDNNPILEVLFCDSNNLQNLTIQNGANSLLNGTISNGSAINERFNATNNPNLRCIYVDDVANCNANWLSKDPTSYYVSTVQECNLLSTTTTLNSKFTLSPNPVENYLNISTPNDLEIYEIKIFTIDRKQIQVNYNNFEQIDLSNLVTGIFTIEITTNSGKYFKKLIKK